MAGTVHRVGARIARRATAMGLSGLAIALFVGVMAFAFTTSPAASPRDTHTSYLSNASKVAELTSFAAARLQSIDRSNVIPGSANAFESARELAPLLTSRITEDDFPDSTTSGADAAASDATLLRAESVPPADLEARAIQAPTVAPTALATPVPSAADVEAGVPDSVPPVPTTTPAPPPPPPPPPMAPNLLIGDEAQATVSFYYCELGSEGRAGDGGRFCGAMRNGEIVYDGAAACAYKYLGQRFRILGDPTDRIYTCADTGSAVHGLHRDIWFHTSTEGWDWQRIVGRTATIIIVP